MTAEKKKNRRRRPGWLCAACLLIACLLSAGCGSAPKTKEAHTSVGIQTVQAGQREDAAPAEREEAQNAPSPQITQEELRILCIGNSHTSDYTAFLPVMLEDLAPYLQTKIIFVTAPMMGGRTLCYPIAAGEEYDPGCYRDILADPAHPEHESYRALLAEGWNLILIQDWHESMNIPSWHYPGGTAFAQALGPVVALLRELSPGAKIAWFADWVDSEIDAEREILYRDSTDAMEAAKNLPQGQRPDWILPASTVLANARTSYLGKTRNPARVIRTVDGSGEISFSDYAGEEVCLYPVLSRDETHLSLELGRYLAGEAVLAHVLSWFGDCLALTPEGEALHPEGAGFLALLHTDPVWEQDGAFWAGEMTPELRAVLLEAVSNTLREPREITQASEAWRTDPMERAALSMQAALAEVPAASSMSDEALFVLFRDGAVLDQLGAVLGKSVSGEQVHLIRTEAGDVQVFVDCHIGYSFQEAPVLILPASP